MTTKWQWNPSKGIWEKIPILNRGDRIIKLGGGGLAYIILILIFFFVLMFIFGQLFIVIGGVMLLISIFAPMPLQWRLMLMVAGVVFLFIGIW